MSVEAVTEWNGSPVGVGPLVVMASSPAGTPVEDSFVVADAADGGLVALPTGRLPEFIRVHRGTAFVAADSRPLLAALTEAPKSEVHSVWSCTTTSLWTDLGLLDLLVRVANGDFAFRRRSEAELAGDFNQNAGSSATNRHEISSIPYQNPTFRDRITVLLATQERLTAEIARLPAEVERPLTAEYRLRATQEAEEYRATLSRRIPKLLRDRENRLALQTGEAAERPTAVGLTSQTPGTVPPATSAGGVATLVRGNIASEMMAPFVSPDRLIKAELDELREAAEERYLHASRLLAQSQEVRTVFQWGGERVVRKAGHVQETKALRGWLRKAAGRLLDRWHDPAPVPRDSAGGHIENPELWGCWVSCDRALWGWREVHRMAEVIRFAAADRPRSPRYELLPHLRSHKPNWEVYRRCGVPVLRPQPGHIFLAGRVRDLRLRSFVAVGLRHGYFTRTTSRLAGHFLDTGHFPDEKEPFTQIAAELYVADALRRADVNHPPVTGSSDRPAESEYEGHFRADALRRAAEEQFDVLLSDRPLEAGVWVRRARGLLDAAILGLPESSLGVFLECEHREPTLDTLGATRALNLLASEIVSELRAYLEDRSTDIIWARLGRSAQDEMYKRFSSSHPETFPARVRNTLTHVGVEGLNLGHDTHTPAGESGRESAEDGPGLFLVRGRTLGGRFTAVCSQPVVRQQEVLLSADEVMLEVAHALCAGGYRLLAVAGEEFLVEVAERDHEAAARVVNEIGTAVAAQLLGELAVVSVEARERW